MTAGRRSLYNHTVFDRTPATGISGPESRHRLQYIQSRQVPALPALERERSSLNDLTVRPVAHISLIKINERQ